MPACVLAAAGCLVSMGATMQANAQELRVGTDTSYIEVYGQLDKAFLYYDDGQQQKFYPLVDNDSSSSRFGVRAYQLRDNGVAIGANAEFEWEPYSTDYVNLLTAHDVDIADLSLRKAEIYLSHDAFGKLWVGRGSMASDNTSAPNCSVLQMAPFQALKSTTPSPIWMDLAGKHACVTTRQILTVSPSVLRSISTGTGMPLSTTRRSWAIFR
jgi:hypothetical protein